MQQEKGKLYVVATPIGNLDDITVRARDILSQVTFVAAEDTRHSKVLLSHLHIHTPLIAYHDHNEATKTAFIIEKLQQGKSIALISDAGTPLISDPGYDVVAKALEAGIQVIPIPGACALTCALSASGLPTDKFFFEGFLPAKDSARRKRLTALKDFPNTLIFYEAPHRLAALIADLCDIFSPMREATIAREITKKFETITKDSLGTLLLAIQRGEIPAKGECVVVVQGASREENEENHAPENKRILEILLQEVPLKQAVQIAVKMTNQPKNALYDLAMELKRNAT